MPTKPTTRGRGRPAFQATAAMRRKVEIAAGGGMRHEDIALALGICRDTLEKHFQKELSAGANSRRLEVLNALFMSAKKGSSSAAKAYLAISPEFMVPPVAEGQQATKGQGAAAAAPVAAPAPVPKPVAQPLGKKGQADEDAKTAHRGTGWEDLLTPGAPPANTPLQ